MTEPRTIALLLVLATPAVACSGNNSDPAPAVTSVEIIVPSEGESFLITPTAADIDVEIKVQNFALAPLGQEGNDPLKGQVRLFVDSDLCNDPGHPPDEPAVPYNAILPNAANESHIGMDYCLGGVPALDNKSHTLDAQLWHGDTRLTEPKASHRITFRTTYSAEGGTPEPADGAAE